MKILASTKVDLVLNPGDTFNLLYVRTAFQEETGKELYRETTKVLSHVVTKVTHIDIAHVVEFEDGDLGLEYGIGGVFGKKKT